MTPKNYRRFSRLLLLLVFTAGIEAKGTTVRLTVTGPSLERTIEITDPALLGMSNVWEGAFIGAPLDRAQVVEGASYTVSFDVQFPEWQRRGIKTAYEVRIVRDPAGGLLLYLPGRGEPGYGRNVNAILRDGQDGRWHKPSAAWSEALANHLP